MVFESKDWEFSNMTAENTQPEEGDQYLLIQSAMYNPDTAQMDINFKSLSNDATFRIRYFMLTKQGNHNGFTARVLRSLGKAVNNEDKVLAPCDIEGAVVRANVKFTVPKNEGDKTYPTIEEYLPIPEEVLGFSEKPDQYCITSE